MIRFSIALAVAAASSAQVSLVGVRSGHVADEQSRVLRPVIGMPGSAYLGSAVALPFGPVSARTVSGGMVAVSESGEAWLVRGLETRAAAEKLAPANRVFASERAVSAVLHSDGEGALRLVSGLDKAPAAGPPIDLVTLRGTFQNAAIDESTGCAILVTASEAETFLYRLCPARPAEPVLVRAFGPMDVAAAAYAAKMGLILADRAGGRIVHVRTPVESGEVRTLASIPDPAGVQPVSASQVLAVSGDPARAWLIDVSGKAAPASVDLPLPAEKLEFLTAGAVLVCNRLRDGPLLVIDATQDHGAFLVPAPGSPE